MSFFISVPCLLYPINLPRDEASIYKRKNRYDNTADNTLLQPWEGMIKNYTVLLLSRLYASSEEYFWHANTTDAIVSIKRKCMCALSIIQCISHYYVYHCNS